MPGNEDAGEEQNGRGQDHRDADAVHAEVELNPELLGPEVVLLKLVAALVPVEREQQIERGKERDAGKEHGHLAHQERPAVGDKQEDHGAHERREQNDAEEVAFGHGGRRLSATGETICVSLGAFTKEPRSSRSVNACTEPFMMFRNGAG